jgi:hypothetical protein
LFDYEIIYLTLKLILFFNSKTFVFKNNMR